MVGMTEAWPEPRRLGIVDAGLSHMGDGVWVIPMDDGTVDGWSKL